MPPWRRLSPLECSDGDETDEGGELARVVEAGEVAEFGDDGDGDDPLHAAQGLQGLDDGVEPPVGDELEEFCLDALEPLDLLVDGAHVFLEDDLLRRRRADDRGEVAPVGVVPVGAAGVVESEAEQEGLEAVAWRP